MPYPHLLPTGIRTFRHWITGVLLLVPAALPIPDHQASACTPDPVLREFTFLDAEWLLNPGEFMATMLPPRLSAWYGPFRIPEDRPARDENLLEWQERVCREATTDEIAAVVYKASLPDLSGLAHAVRNPKEPLPAALQDNAFASFLQDNRCTETSDYLLFAKRCEPHVVHPTDAWRPAPRDTGAMLALLDAGAAAFRQTRSDYLRLRYAYQLVRLAHYAGNARLAIDLWDDLRPKIDKRHARFDQSILPWWIASHVAGALRQIGHHARAARLFAAVFLHCPGKRTVAWRSFHIPDDETWKEALRLCLSDEERASLHCLRALGPRTKALVDMQAIQELSPESPMLEWLLLQELRKMERNLLGASFNSQKDENRRQFRLPSPDAGPYAVQLQAFVRQVRPTTNNPYLWLLAEGYLQWLSGDHYAAARTFGETAVHCSDKKQESQLLALQTALKIDALRQIGPDAESLAYQLVRDNPVYTRYPAFPDFLRDKLHALYLSGNQPGKAFLSRYTLDELRPNPLPDVLEDLIRIARRPDLSPFESLLLDQIRLHDLLDLKATLLLSRGQVEAAMETYRDIPAGKWDDYGRFSPFRESFGDCIRCPDTAASDPFDVPLNKGEILEKLLELQYKARADVEHAADHYYRIGLAWYNMSYFGTAWAAMDYHRSGATWLLLPRSQPPPDGNGVVFPRWPLPFGNRENTDLHLAFDAFSQALLLSRDPELTARAAFQAARCQQKIAFHLPGSLPHGRNRIPAPSIPQERLFRLLIDHYSQTEAYRLIIRECKYFEAFSKHG